MYHLKRKPKERMIFAQSLVHVDLSNMGSPTFSPAIHLILSLCVTGWHWWPALGVDLLFSSTDPGEMQDVVHSMNFFTVCDSSNPSEFPFRGDTASSLW